MSGSPTSAWPRKCFYGCARNTRHRFRLSSRTGRTLVSLPYWLALIEAICRRDAEAAKVALERHADNVQESMKALAQNETPFAAPRRLMQVQARICATSSSCQLPK